MKKFKDFYYDTEDDDFETYKKTDSKKKNVSWKADRKNKNKERSKSYDVHEDD